jgi:hypothetical protein
VSLNGRLRPTQRSVEKRFKDALLAFSDDPTASNLARYLAASRALAETPRTAAEAALTSMTPMTSAASAGHS